jgi:glucose-6-phosphate isomerase
MTIRIDYTNMLTGAVAGGVAAGDWQEAQGRFPAVRADLVAQYQSGRLGFLDLPRDEALHRQSTDFARRAAGRFDDVVVLGIGGSALGPIALRTALRPSGWNSLSTERRQGRPRLHVLDNVDPATISALLERLDLARSLFIVTSKSGGTAETMAQYLVVRERLQRARGDSLRDHLVFVTDPQKGALRAIANSDRIPALDIPPAVGGRFSVLTPVGVLPAALIGIDTAELLAGAGDMARRCETDELRRNPAGVFATLQMPAQP